MTTKTTHSHSRFASTIAAAALSAAAVLGQTQTASAQGIERMIVYIECRAGDQVSRGSGVIVSPEGHVLTAKHVVPQGSQCAGSIGVADNFDLQRLNIQPQQALGFDAMLLKFARSEEYDYAGYCPFEQLAARKKIFVAGFPGRTETGAPSYREGILSTTALNSTGVIETDGQSVGGMSGGPVFSENLAGIVGIVSGAKFDASGAISYYGILPVSTVAQMFGLQASAKPCYTEYRWMDIVDKETGDFADEWRASDGRPLDLGVNETEGFCFLTRVFGEFNDPDDSVFVELKDGQFFLDGENFSGEEHGGRAACIRFSN